MFDVAVKDRALHGVVHAAVRKKIRQKADKKPRENPEIVSGTGGARELPQYGAGSEGNITGSVHDKVTQLSELDSGEECGLVYKRNVGPSSNVGFLPTSSSNQRLDTIFHKEVNSPLRYRCRPFIDTAITTSLVTRPPDVRLAIDNHNTPFMWTYV